MNDFLHYYILHNTVKDWSITIGIILISFLLLKLFAAIVVKRLKKLTAGTKTTLDDFIIFAVNNSFLPVMYLLAIYFGLQYLQATEKVKSILGTASVAVLTFFIIRFVMSLLKYLIAGTIAKDRIDDSRARRSKGILLIAQAVLWTAGFLFLIDNLGYDITTLIAGLGIGGIAIALAAQTILGDLFNYLVIFFDKPFEEGDFIIVDEKMGTVEYIGIKTTRLRTLGGEQLICSNTDLTNSRVHNFKRMQERRVVFTFSVVYDTLPEKLRKIPILVKNIIRSVGNARFDRTHFKSFGDFSLNFEVVYYVLSADYNMYMDRQETINLRLVDLFHEEEIEFAFPTQTIILNRITKENALTPDRH